MSKPQWSKSAFAMSGPKLEDDSMPENTFDVLLDQEMPHSDFVNFFSDITTIDQEAVDHYPVIARAVAFVRAASDEQGQENARVMCLFYVAIIFKHASRLPHNQSWLDNYLSVTESSWGNCIESLRWLLRQAMCQSFGRPETSD